MKMRTVEPPAAAAPSGAVEASPPSGSRLLPLQVLSDPRGTLSFGEVGKPLPFTPVRYFTVSDVPPAAVRGDHAHRECHEFLVMLAGSCIVELDDGSIRQEFPLSGLSEGLHVAPLTWIKLREFSRGALLLVLASHAFDESDYLRRHDDFLIVVHGQLR